jgi:hypothetical protein
LQDAVSGAELIGLLEQSQLAVILTRNGAFASTVLERISCTVRDYSPALDLPSLFPQNCSNLVSGRREHRRHHMPSLCWTISDKRGITETFNNLQAAGIDWQMTSPGETFTNAPAHAAAQSIQPAFGLLPEAASESRSHGISPSTR